MLPRRWKPAARQLEVFFGRKAIRSRKPGQSHDTVGNSTTCALQTVLWMTGRIDGPSVDRETLIVVPNQLFVIPQHDILHLDATQLTRERQPWRFTLGFAARMRES